MMCVSIYDLLCLHTPVVSVTLAAHDPVVISEGKFPGNAAGCSRSAFFIGCCVKIYPDTTIVLLFLIGHIIANQKQLSFLTDGTDTGALMGDVLDSCRFCVAGVRDKRPKRVTVTLIAWHFRTLQLLFCREKYDNVRWASAEINSHSPLPGPARLPSP